MPLERLAEKVAAARRSDAGMLSTTAARSSGVVVIVATIETAAFRSASTALRLPTSISWLAWVRLAEMLAMGWLFDAWPSAIDFVTTEAGPARDSTSRNCSLMVSARTSCQKSALCAFGSAGSLAGRVDDGGGGAAVSATSKMHCARAAIRFSRSADDDAGVVEFAPRRN